MRIQMKNNIIDKLLLIVVAAATLFCLIGAMILMEGRFALSKDWSLFLLFSVGYAVFVTKGCYCDIKKQKSSVKIIMFILIMICVIGIFYSMFFFKIITFPQRNIGQWGIGTIAIAYITIVACTKLLRK